MIWRRNRHSKLTRVVSRKMIFVQVLLLCVAHLVLQTEGSPIQGHGNIIVEGDMMITADEPSDNAEVITHLGGDISKRTVVKAKARRWKDGVLPYEISDDFSPEAKKFIADAIAEFNSLSCVHLRRRDESDRQWVKIHNWHGCFSAVGYAYWSDGERIISINESMCLATGIVHHEILHSLGFYHEHSRADRDKVVRINWENIKEGKEHNFLEFPKSVLDLEGEYDYGSLMHYGPKAFSKNGRDTIVPIRPLAGNQVMGQKKEMTKEDLRKLYELYDCKNEGRWTEWSAWSKCNSKGRRERTRYCYYPLSKEDAKKCKGDDEETKKCKIDKKRPTDQPTSRSTDRSTKKMWEWGRILTALRKY